MRLVALVPGLDEEVKRVILYEADDGAHLFLSRSVEDKGCFADEWYECAEDAQAACHLRFGIELGDWQKIPDPMPGCQHDWIAPVRIKGRNQGRPEWGVFERLVEGEWVSISDL